MSQTALQLELSREFVLEKLFRGSIINYRTFFLEEDGKVFYEDHDS